MGKVEKTSLDKSHSKLSNTKLTLICMLLSIGFVFVFAGLALIDAHKTIGIVTASIAFVVSLFGLILVQKFTR